MVFIFIYVLLIVGVIFYHPSYLKLNISLTKKDFQYIGGLLLIALGLIALFFKLDLLTFTPRYNLFHSIVVALTILIIIAPAEELIFRGIIQTHLMTWIGTIGGLIVASMFFGAAHLPNDALGFDMALWNWKMAAISGAGGILFGIAFINCSSILGPVILHAILSILYSLFIR